MQLALLYVKQFKKIRIMKTVELSFNDWVYVFYALGCKKDQLKEAGLEEDVENVERIRTLIRDQIE